MSRNKIHILFLENGVSGGGSFESLYQLVTHIDPERFRPIVVFVNRTAFYDRLKERNIDAFLIKDPVYSITSNRLIKGFILKLNALIEKYFSVLGVFFDGLIHFPAITSLERIVERHDIDLIHLNNQSIRDLYGVILARRTRTPCVSHLRSVRTKIANPRKIGFLNHHVSRFIANSSFAQTHWINLGIPSDKITTVYNGIDCIQVEPLNIRREWGISDRFTFILGCVANLVDSKGHAFLLTAFEQVLKKVPDCLLLIVGDGEHREELVNLSRRLTIQDSVLFTGYDPRARQIIATLDVLILSSFQEAFGRTLLEAMLGKTPIVATRTGGIPEVVQHEYNGLLVDYDDVDGLSNAIVRLLREPMIANDLVENGYSDCKERFQISRHVNTLEEIYRSLINEETPV